MRYTGTYFKYHSQLLMKAHPLFSTYETFCVTMTFHHFKQYYGRANLKGVMSLSY